MATNGYTVFETAHGHAGVAWRGDAITRFRLPAATTRETERALLRSVPDAHLGEPPAPIAAAIAAAQRYFAGDVVDFADLILDLGEQEPFFARVYDHIRQIGRGETTTYGAIAKALGAGPEAARDVGQAMARNPVPLIVPCHRVLGAGGKIGGFSAPGGSEAKARMLALEGVATQSPATAASPARVSGQTAFSF